MRDNVKAPGNQPKEIVNNSKLLTAGDNSPTKFKSKSKVMINPVPVDISKRNRNNTSVSSPKSILKQPSTILTKSLMMGNSAVSFQCWIDQNFNSCIKIWEYWDNPRNKKSLDPNLHFLAFEDPIVIFSLFVTTKLCTNCFFRLLFLKGFFFPNSFFFFLFEANPLLFFLLLSFSHLFFILYWWLFVHRTVCSPWIIVRDPWCTCFLQCLLFVIIRWGRFLFSFVFITTGARAHDII